MGYKDGIITEKFPTLGDDVWVTIKDPEFLTDAEAETRPVAKNPDGTENEDDRLTAYYELLASLVIDASLFDKADNSPIKVPLTVEDLRSRIPRRVRKFISKTLQESSDPQ